MGVPRVRRGVFGCRWVASRGVWRCHGGGGCADGGGVGVHLAPAGRVAVVGFSQGGLMATQLLRTRPEQVAATVVLSGLVQAAPQPADERPAAERPPVFWGRGGRDRLVIAEAIERTGQWPPAHSTQRAGHGRA